MRESLGNKPAALPSHIELWAGPECTCNRVQDRYYDQLDQTGHRLDDLRLIAELGAKAVRYPVLWERTMPNQTAPAEWTWPDERLRILRELGIRPIVGLLHHGSGPRHTNLLDANFAPKFANYAAALARRYPWLNAYTPVNEPLTTARFSGLYGHWYPHCKDDRSFVSSLLNQCRATVLAMQEIRLVNLGAQLIQTEDLGHVDSSPLLQYQADFENERRWLSLDLLCGKVTPEHPLWQYLLSSGASEGELLWFAEHSSPPDVIGFNYYLTSQRFLHEKLSLYPPQLHGGNRRHRYADVERVRVHTDGLVKLETLLQSAWERYGIPVAITECHNGCTREEQLRWQAEVWNSCELARAAGIHVRAVTAWSLLGAMDWNTLLTQNNGHYEPGVFDVRSPKPRATGLATAWKRLGAGGKFEHPILEVPGWWRRSERLVHGFEVGSFGTISPTSKRHKTSVNERFADVQPLLIAGARGTLGRHLGEGCEQRAIPYRLLTRAEMDITDARSVELALGFHAPWAVINAAGYVRVDEGEADPLCWRENAIGPNVLAEACAAKNIPLVTFSSDLVFDGAKTAPYIEADQVAPLNEYGRSKAAAEEGVLKICAKSLIIRTSAFFSAADDYNFVTAALRALQEGRTFKALTDCVISPTFVPDLAQHTLDLLIDEETGIWHLANRGEITWYELARRAAEKAEISVRTLLGITLEEMELPALRPRYSALTSERGLIMPTLDSALHRYISQAGWLQVQLAA